MIRLLLCRHGESGGDMEPRRLEGNADFPLTDLGLSQGRSLARWIAAQYKVDLLLSSPLQRALQTARLIGEAVDRPVTVEPRLTERSHGVLAGLTREEADRRYPVRQPVPVYHRPPEGESYLDQFRRVAEFYFETYFNTEIGGKTVVAVAHGGTINCLLDAALGLPPLAQVDFACAHTCVHELQIHPGGRIRVVRLNDTSHLAGAL